MKAGEDDPGGTKSQVHRERLVVFIGPDIGTMNANYVADSQERRKALLVMSEESHRDAAIVGICPIPWMLVVHRWVHDLEQLSVKVLLRVRCRRINHDSVEIVQLSVAQTCLSKGRIGTESL